MKSKGLIFIQGLVIVAILLTTSVFAEEHEHLLEIKLSKSAYLTHEQIWLEITFTNSSSDTLRTYGLSYPNHRGFTISVKNNNGQDVEYNGLHADFGGGPGKLLLKAGEKDYGSFSVLELYGISGAFNGFPNWKFPLIHAGTYTVQAQYQGTLSKELTFTINEPAGDEKVAIELIEKAINAWRKENRLPSAQLYQEVLDRFPNSVYAEQCFYFARSYTDWGDISSGAFDKRIIYGGMLRNYPNSGNVYNLIIGIIYVLEHPENTRESDTSKQTINNVINFFNEIIGANPDSKAAKIANQLLKKYLADRKVLESEACPPDSFVD